MQCIVSSATAGTSLAAVFRRKRQAEEDINVSESNTFIEVTEEANLHEIGTHTTTTLYSDQTTTANSHLRTSPYTQTLESTATVTLNVGVPSDSEFYSSVNTEETDSTSIVLQPTTPEAVVTAKTIENADVVDDTITAASGQLQSTDYSTTALLELLSNTTFGSTTKYLKTTNKYIEDVIGKTYATQRDVPTESTFTTKTREHYNTDALPQASTQDSGYSTDPSANRFFQENGSDSSTIAMASTGISIYNMSAESQTEAMTRETTMIATSTQSMKNTANCEWMCDMV